MPVLIAAGVAVALVVVIAVLARRRGKAAAPAAAARLVMTLEAGPPRPAVAEFHVAGGAARVHFDVPLPAAGADEVLSDLLGREAVEVVREKRHTLPLGDLSRVVALGRRGAEWAEVATIRLDTPGQLPPPLPPRGAHPLHHDFDPFDRMSELPQTPPGLAPAGRGERLERLALRLPAGSQAAVRALGIDPATAEAPAVVLALLRATGHQVTELGPGTLRAERAGVRTFVRVVPHRPEEHPELGEQEIRRFVVDFGASGAGRGLLLSEKWSPFEVHERERRDPRVRFITRERLQAFADALAIGGG